MADPNSRTPLSPRPTDLERAIHEEVMDLSAPLVDLSHRIHANPELGHEERLASAWCAEILRSNAFEITAPVAGLETAFRARRGRGRPAVAFLAEYDALPGVGHACGHNIIAASTVGAGLALARALHRTGVAATVIVDGTPAEETTGGKIPMVEAGLYEDVDVAFSMHPQDRTAAGGTSLGVRRLALAFHGRAAHAAAEPEKGVNALDAVLQTFAAVNALRQHVRPDVRIHGIITDGGRATNIVPDFARCEISVRSVDPGYLSALVEKVLNCARAAALASGARLEASQAEAYAPIRENRVLDGLVLEVMEDLGCPGEDLRGACFPASTDFGNVSQVVPATAVMFKVAPPGVVLHHPDFAAASVSPEADEVVLTAARVLAVAAARLVTDPARLEEVRAAGR